MTGHVFISYSHAADSSYVDQLAQYLTDAGIKVWFDREIIHGERWERVIREKVDSCTALIVVMTPAAEDSDWVGREINRAELKGKPVLPLLLKGEPFFRLSTLQFEDVTGSRMPSPAFLTRLGGTQPERTEPAKVVTPQRLPQRHRQVSILTDAGKRLAFSPDGTVLACGSKTVRMWNIADPAHPVPTAAPAEQTGQIRSIAFSPDGTVLACGGEGREARLWSLNQLDQPVATLIGHTGIGGEACLVAFSPDGSMLATGGERKIRLWNVASPGQPALLAKVTAQNNFLSDLRALAFSPDGTILATGGGDQMVRLWDLTDPVHPVSIAALAGHSNLMSLAFSPAGTLLAATTGKKVRLWNITDMKRPAPSDVLKAQTGLFNELCAVAFSKDGTFLATGGWDKMVRFWDITGPANPELFATLEGHTDTVLSLEFSPNGAILASSGTDDTVRLWDV